MNSNTSSILNLFLNIVKDNNHKLTKDSVILDFGCGSGRIVQELHVLGYNAYGCDVKFKQEKDIDTKSMSDNKAIRLITLQPYKLPYDDNTFDFIFSNQVFEHVKNYPETLSEIKRILKPNGYTLHIFPSRYNPLEPHVFVPFASIIQSYGWLYFWSKFGIRNKKQRNLSARETAKNNFEYLSENTNYLSKKEINKYFKQYFYKVDFCEDAFLKNTRRGKYIYAISKLLPILPFIYSALRMRVLLAHEPMKNITPDNCSK